MSNEIQHQGIVQEMTETTYFIAMERTAACQGCTAEKFCNFSGDGARELIPVHRFPHQNFQKGDEVTILMSEKNGWRAALYGYILPFFVLMAGIIISVLYKLSQGVAGLIGIGTLILYYLIFSLFRKKIDRKFIFRIE